MASGHQLYRQPYHPTSASELNSEVMAGVAVEITARSRNQRKYVNVTGPRIKIHAMRDSSGSDVFGDALSDDAFLLLLPGRCGACDALSANVSASFCVATCPVPFWLSDASAMLWRYFRNRVLLEPMRSVWMFC